MQDAETRYQLRRLSHHPSIVMLDACNECSAKDLWFSFVLPIIADEDPSRPLWPACPSAGFSSGVDRLTGLVNGRPLALKAIAASAFAPPPAPARSPLATCTPYADADYAHGAIWVDAPAADLGACCDACVAQAGCVAGVLFAGVCYMKNASMVAQPSWAPGLASAWVPGHTPVPPPSAGCNTGLTLETHGYYQHGEGFKTVNSGADLQPFSPNLPPALDPAYDLGTGCPGTFASEFGASAWSSFESVSPTLDPAHWSAHADVMYERNYALDNFVTTYFGVPWPAYFTNSTLQAQLYLALIAQGLLVKSDISTRRARNSFGTVTWQLNECVCARSASRRRTHAVEVRGWVGGAGPATSSAPHPRLFLAGFGRPAGGARSNTAPLGSRPAKFSAAGGSRSCSSCTPTCTRTSSSCAAPTRAAW